MFENNNISDIEKNNQAKVASDEFEDRWYYDIVAPVLPRLVKMLEPMKINDISEIWETPRAGLAGAIAIHIANFFGAPKWNYKIGKLAIIFAETYNQIVYSSLLSSQTYSRRIGNYLTYSKIMKQSQILQWKYISQNSAILINTVEHLFAKSNLGIPETVFFLRLAAASGALLGGVPNKTYLLLERQIIWLGLSWEIRKKAIDTEVWDRVFSIVGYHQKMPEVPQLFVKKELQKIVSMLPECPPLKLLEKLIHSVSPKKTHHSNLNEWAIRESALNNFINLVPPKKTHHSNLNEWAIREDVLNNFINQWLNPIQRSMEEIFSKSSGDFEKAIFYVKERGGKRIRPLIVLASAQACGGDPNDALSTASVVEWTHQLSLIIDDVIDKANIRQNNVTLHQATSIFFTVEVCIFICTKILSRVKSMDVKLQKEFLNLLSAMCAGEELDLKYVNNFKLSLRTYYNIIQKKTASLFAFATVAGAWSSNVPENKVHIFRHLGYQIGIAFQIMDDLLDYTSTLNRLGKEPGTDLRESKMTLPLIILRNQLNGRQKKQLKKALGDITALHWIKQKMKEKNVEARCKEYALNHIRNVNQAINILEESEGRKVLEGLTTAFTNRSC